MKRLVLAVAAALLPVTAFAQQAPPNWPTAVESGLQTVYVLDDTGAETSGKLLQLNADSLVLQVGDIERRFEAARIKRVQRRGDSLRNGAIIGAIVGVVAGVFSGGLADCPGDDPGGSCVGSRAALVAISTGIYTALGAGVDALITGRTTLYEVKTTSLLNDRRGSMAAAVGRRGVLSLRVRW